MKPLLTLEDKMNTMNAKKEWLSLIVGYLGAFLGLGIVVLFNHSILMSLPLVLRMVLMIVIYLLIAAAPIVVMLVNKDKLSDYGFAKEKIGLQVIVGAAIGIALSLVLTLLPHLVGFGDYVTNGKSYTHLWQFAYEFLYCILAVGFAEEFVFRGFVYEKIKRISQKDAVAAAASSVLFGLFHIFGGNIVQVIVTALIGAFFCLCRLKIKNCSLLSLIIAHGIYDALITVWAAVFR